MPRGRKKGSKTRSLDQIRLQTTNMCNSKVQKFKKMFQKKCGGIQMKYQLKPIFKTIRKGRKDKGQKRGPRGFIGPRRPRRIKSFIGRIKSARRIRKIDNNKVPLLALTN